MQGSLFIIWKVLSPGYYVCASYYHLLYNINNQIVVHYNLYSHTIFIISDLLLGIACQSICFGILKGITQGNNNIRFIHWNVYCVESYFNLLTSYIFSGLANKNKTFDTKIYWHGYLLIFPRA